MSMGDWDQRVFRLRGLPKSISSRSEAAELVSTAIGVPLCHVAVDSLARISEVWAPPVKLATLRLRALPPHISKSLEDEWAIPLPGTDHSELLILDTHFRGVTVLHDPDPLEHVAE
jgi:hypothetical protein